MELLGFLLGAIAIAFVIAKVIFSSKEDACIHRRDRRLIRRRSRWADLPPNAPGSLGPWHLLGVLPVGHTFIDD